MRHKEQLTNLSVSDWRCVATRWVRTACAFWQLRPHKLQNHVRPIDIMSVFFNESGPVFRVFAARRGLGCGMKVHSSKGQGDPHDPQAPQPPPVPIEVVKAALKRHGVRYGPAKEPRLRQLYEGWYAFPLTCEPGEGFASLFFPLLHLCQS